MRFKDQVVVVTGSTRGIGRQIAELFAEEGATVIILGRNEALGNEVRDQIKAKGQSADSFSCDVADTENAREIVNKILDKHNHVDILINNAGVTKDNLLLRMTENDWDQVMEVNLKGVFNFTRTFLKVMLKAKKGRVINISSVIGLSGNTGQANYAASKAGLIGFTKSVALEIATRGITVNAIAPGYIETDMTNQLSDKAREEKLRGIPMARFGKAKDVVAACMFLASEQANYITGQTLVVDGGMTI